MPVLAQSLSLAPGWLPGRAALHEVRQEIFDMSEAGFSMLGYANQRVEHYWKASDTSNVHSLCGRMASTSYLLDDGYSGLPNCKTCMKKLEKEYET